MGAVLRYSSARVVAGLIVRLDLLHKRPHVPDLIGLRNDYALQVRVVGRYFFDLGSC